MIGNSPIWGFVGARIVLWSREDGRAEVSTVSFSAPGEVLLQSRLLGHARRFRHNVATRKTYCCRTEWRPEDGRHVESWDDGDIWEVMDQASAGAVRALAEDDLAHERRQMGGLLEELEDKGSIGDDDLVALAAHGSRIAAAALRLRKVARHDDAVEELLSGTARMARDDADRRRTRAKKLKRAGARKGTPE